MRTLLFLFITLLFFGQATAAERILPLPADQAFAFSIYFFKKDQLVLQWKIAPDYYLYRDKIAISLLPDSEVKLGQIILPNGTLKHGLMQHIYAIYSGNFTLSVPLLYSNKTKLHLKVSYQGCAEKGFCYSPIDKELVVNLSSLNTGKNITSHILQGPVVRAVALSPQDYAKKIFEQKSTLVILLSFFGLGILLSLTPCVLPMVPILSGIIIGHGKQFPSLKSFSLSLAYVLGMALTYAFAGLLVARLGSHLPIELQRPWVIVLFSGLFIVLAFSLFGLYGLQLPRHWRQRLTALTHRQKGGSYLGVFLMGSFSSLIISPCVSPVLVGVLAYVAQTGDSVMGALALFAVGLGMGLPLLLLGASLGRLLPRAGRWMETIEKIAGLLMLSVAIWMLSRVLSGPVTLFLWSVLAMGSAFFIGTFFKTKNDRTLLMHGLALIVFIYGIILLLGAALGNSNPFQPLAGGADFSSMAKPTFITLKNSQQLDKELKDAALAKKLVLLDFYADWCESCIKMERNVFNTPEVKNALATLVLLRADVTANTDFDQVLLKRFNVIAPPSILFFAVDGKEIMSARIIGEMNSKAFLNQLTKIKDRESASQ